MSQLGDIKTGLARSRERLLSAIEGVSERQFKQRPEPDSWSIAEVLAHLLDSEQTWTDRIAAALSDESVKVAASGPEQNEERAAAGRAVAVPMLIHGLLAARRRLEKVIDGMEEADLERTVEHERRGRLTLAWVLDFYGPRHELEHVAQIEAIKQRTTASPQRGSNREKGTGTKEQALEPSPGPGPELVVPPPP